MTSIGPNTPHAGCPDMATTATPALGSYPRTGLVSGGGAAPPTTFGHMFSAHGGHFDAPSSERFVSSSTGGVILGADGSPSGSVPAGSFIDTKDGKIYGADGKPIALPTGATVDFFDLPDVAAMMAAGNAPTTRTPQPAGTTVAGGGAATAPMKTAVGGQWGPAGVAPTPVACNMDHGPATTKAGGGAAALVSSVAGARGLGTTPTLESSIADLVATLRALTMAMSATSGGGGMPSQITLQVPPTAPRPITPPATTTSGTTSTTTTGSGTTTTTS